MTDPKKQPSLLEEIHAQPEHVRSILMWLCVVVTIAVIGSFWLKSTKEQIAALSNPQMRTENARIYADKSENESQSESYAANSPFNMLSGLGGQLGAVISAALSGSSSMSFQSDLKKDSSVGTKQQQPEWALPVISDDE